MISLKSAVATIHRDRLWWRKILVGGVLWLSIVGYPIVEGFQLESIENTEKGFPAPLPRWDMLGTKFVLGIFAAVIDFFFFIFPLSIVGLLLVCGALAISLSGTDDVRLLGPIIFVVVSAYIAVAWISSASPVAKRLYANEGRLEQALSVQVVRDGWIRPARGCYQRARLQSLPLYFVPLAFFAAAWTSLTWSGWLALLFVWLGLSALFYVRLAVIQLYAAASQEIVRLKFEAFQRQLQQ